MKDAIVNKQEMWKVKVQKKPPIDMTSSESCVDSKSHRGDPLSSTMDNSSTSLLDQESETSYAEEIKNAKVNKYNKLWKVKQVQQKTLMDKPSSGNFSISFLDQEYETSYVEEIKDSMVNGQETLWKVKPMQQKPIIDMPSSESCMDSHCHLSDLNSSTTTNSCISCFDKKSDTQELREREKYKVKKKNDAEGKDKEKEAKVQRVSKKKSQRSKKKALGTLKKETIKETTTVVEEVKDAVVNKQEKTWKPKQVLRKALDDLPSSESCMDSRSHHCVMHSPSTVDSSCTLLLNQESETPYVDEIKEAVVDKKKTFWKVKQAQEKPFIYVPSLKSCINSGSHHSNLRSSIMDNDGISPLDQESGTSYTEEIKDAIVNKQETLWNVKKVQEKPLIDKSSSTPMQSGKNTGESDEQDFVPREEVEIVLHDYKKQKMIRELHFNLEWAIQYGLESFIDKLEYQGWTHLFTSICSSIVYSDEVRQFYVNLCVGKVVKTKVNGQKIEFDYEKLGEILGVGIEGYCSYVKDTWPSVPGVGLVDMIRGVTGNNELDSARLVHQCELTPMAKLLFKIVMKNVVPRAKQVNKPTMLDLVYTFLLDAKIKISLPKLIILHLNHIVRNPTEQHAALPYSSIISYILIYFGIPIRGGHIAPLPNNNALDESKLRQLGLAIDKGVLVFDVSEVEEELVGDEKGEPCMTADEKEWNSHRTEGNKEEYRELTNEHLETDSRLYDFLETMFSNVSLLDHETDTSYVEEVKDVIVNNQETPGNIIQVPNDNAEISDSSTDDTNIGNLLTMEVVNKEKRIGLYTSSQKILLVGEGDFSFSSCLATAFGSAANMLATSLDSKEFLVENYSYAIINLSNLTCRGCTVLHGVDCTKMADLFSSMRFDRIIYNFPHAGFFGRDVSRVFQIWLNQVLVSLFLANAKKLLKEDGEIHITHKSNGFFREWEINSLAIHQGLLPLEEVPFLRNDYPGYQTKYGFGGDQSFDCVPSNTYKFGLPLNQKSQQLLLFNPHHLIQFPSVPLCSSLDTNNLGGYTY